jgi:putative PIN family toxin of toxin-antitoxin system
MRVVLDTNIVVRFVYSPSGLILALVQLLQAPQHALVTSQTLLDEATEVLCRPRIRARHQLDDGAIQNALKQLYANSEPPTALPSHATRFVPHDPKDDAVVLTAMNGKADVICTLDKHLHHQDTVNLCAQSGVRIVSDLELLAELRQI